MNNVINKKNPNREVGFPMIRIRSYVSGIDIKKLRLPLQRKV